MTGDTKILVATGAGSRIVSAAIRVAALKLWNKAEPVHMVLSDHPDANLVRTKAAVLALRPDAQVEMRPVDLAAEPFYRVSEGLVNVSWMILGAATGLIGQDPKTVDEVNNQSQVAIASCLCSNNRGCSGVFLNSTYGHNQELPLPHPGYAVVAEPKRRAEEALRRQSRRNEGLAKFNFVVASIVARTGASLLLKRELGNEGYAELARTLPGGREATIDEVAEAVVRALLCEQTGMTFFVPPEAVTVASPEMLALSES